MKRLELKAAWTVTEEGELVGLASVFNTRDRGGDVVRKGAFRSARAPLPMLASHDQADVVGVWDALEEVAEGLKIKGRLLVKEVARAREVLALIKEGAMTGLSIGYVTRKANRTQGGRDLVDVELLEVSVVAVPMHPDARITDAKSQKGTDMDPEELETKLKEIETKSQKAAEALIAAAVAAATKPLTDRLAAVEAKSNRAKGGGENEEPSEERKAFRAYIQRGNLAEEAKALTVSNDPSGGYLAPPEFNAEVLRDIVEISPIRSLASVRGTNAPSVIYPTRKPMGNATWDDELDDETETASNNIFGTLEVVGKGMSTFVDVSNMLLQDAAEVETEVRVALAEDFEKKETVAFCNGNGVTQPEGFMTNTSVAEFNNGHATVLQADALVKFLYSITPSYRNAGVWVMNGTTLGLVRLLKDGQNNYLWQPSYQAGQPETILGRPVVEIIDMPDLASGTFPIAYADFSGYRILDRLALSMLVDPYSQATRKMTRYHAGRRVGGKVIMPAKFKKLKMAV
ncbi:MAG: phage major capsid protein [Rhodobacterales bacterium]|nr:phage major capsid protein [Rhodobacterales bacterium]